MSNEELEEWGNDWKNEKLSSGAFILYLKLYISDFESRTCGSCKYWDKDDSGYGFMLGYCNKDVGNSFTINNATKHDFGCNKWEFKNEL